MQASGEKRCGEVNVLMKVDGNSKGVFISHDGLTVFFNNDGTVKVTRRDDSAVYSQYHTVGEMKADREDMRKFCEMVLASI